MPTSTSTSRAGCAGSASLKEQRTVSGRAKYRTRTFAHDVNGRIRTHVRKTGPDDCWQWEGPRTTNGYGKWNKNGRIRMAHRVIYELLVGPVPEGLELDHLCRNKLCVNPRHLEPVTRTENARRGICGVLRTLKAAMQTYCKRGHPLINAYISPDGHRHCRACTNMRAIEYRRRKKDANPQLTTE